MMNRHYNKDMHSFSYLTGSHSNPNTIELYLEEDFLLLNYKGT